MSVVRDLDVCSESEPLMYRGRGDFCGADTCIEQRVYWEAKSRFEGSKGDGFCSCGIRCVNDSCDGASECVWCSVLLLQTYFFPNPISIR